MDASQIVLTAEGRQKLVEELAWREGDYAKEIVEDIKEAARVRRPFRERRVRRRQGKSGPERRPYGRYPGHLAKTPRMPSPRLDMIVSIGGTVSLVDPRARHATSRRRRYHPDQRARAQDLQRVSGRPRHHRVTARVGRRGRLRLPARRASTPSPRSHARPRSRVKVCFCSLGPNPGERFSLRS